MLARALAKERRTVVRPPVDLGAVAVGVGVTFLLTVTVSALLAVAIYLTDITEAHVTGALYYIGLVAVALGGAAASRKAQARGWLHGALAGTTYVVLSLAVGALLFPQAAVLAGAVTKVLVGAAAGVVGGIVGVNL